MSRNLKNLTIRTSLSQTSDLTTSQNTARSTSIKVIGRFRPLIDFEMVSNIQSLSENKNLITFISDQTVSIGLGKDTESFTLDHIFTPQSTQSEVYELLGKPTIEDVLSGYNGTIFAYGQTGSGKTHTMMGKDIFDEEFRGVIPRAASQIFETVNSDYGEVEYIFTSILCLYLIKSLRLPSSSSRFISSDSTLWQQFWKTVGGISLTVKPFLSQSPSEPL